MGQKVNPISFRTGVFQPWKSRWFAQGREYRKFLLEDYALRRGLEEKFKLAGVVSVDIERLPKAITVKMRVSRPGMVIGRGGQGIAEAKKFVIEKLGLRPNDPNLPKIEVTAEEVKNPELSAKLVAERIAFEIEKRLPHRRVVSKTIERVMAAGAKGVKIALSGRIQGADIARAEKYQEGSVPTQKLRADIDYAHATALLKRGYVGVKVWIYKGEFEE